MLDILLGGAIALGLVTTGGTYFTIALLVYIGYVVVKYSLKAFNKCATVDFEASRYSPPSKTFVNVGVALHVIAVLAILAIVII